MTWNETNSRISNWPWSSSGQEYQPPDCPSPTSAWLGTGAAAIVAIGSLGPWATINMLFFGSVTFGGLAAGGWVTFILSLVAGGIMARAAMAEDVGTGSVVAGTVVFVIAALVAIGFFFNWRQEAAEEGLPLELGWGLLLVIVGSLGGTVLGVVRARQLG